MGLHCVPVERRAVMLGQSREEILSHCLREENGRDGTGIVVGGAEVIASPVVPALLLVETLVCAELLLHHRYKMEASPFLQRVPKGDRQEDTPLRYLLIRQPILCGLLQTFRVAMP